MRVEVDSERCRGHAQCEVACEEVFRIGDDGLAHVLIEYPDESLWDDVHDAYDRCPEDAVVLFEDEEGR
jgi:ferredoxin